MNHTNKDSQSSVLDNWPEGCLTSAPAATPVTSTVSASSGLEHFGHRERVNAITVRPYDPEYPWIWIRAMRVYLGTLGWQEVLDGRDRDPLHLEQVAIVLISKFGDDEMVQRFGMASDGHAVWTTILAGVSSRGQYFRDRLREERRAMRLSNFHTAVEFVQAIRANFEAVEYVGGSLSEEERFCAIARAAGADAEHIRFTIEQLPTRSVEEALLVVSRIVDTGRVQRTAVESVRRGAAREPAAPQAAEERRCHTCKQIGHLARKCPLFREFLGTLDNVVSNSPNSKQIPIGTMILDSGATCHMVESVHLLNKPVSLERPIGIGLADGKTLLSGIAKGELVVSLSNGKHIILKDVLVVPGIAERLLSENRLVEAGYSITKSAETRQVVISDGMGKEVCRLPLELSGNSARGAKESSVEGPIVISPNEGHRRYGHLSESKVRAAAKLSDPPVTVAPGKPDNCIECVVTKMTRHVQNRGAIDRPAAPGDLVYTDILGPFGVKAIDGSEYLSVIVDGASRWCDVRGIKSPSGAEVGKHLEAYVNRERVMHKRNVKRVRSDNGRCYVGPEFKGVIDRLGIEHEYTAEYTPEQNGVVERRNREIQEGVRVNLKSASLPPSLWLHAAKAFVYVHNGVPVGEVKDKTPKEVHTGRRMPSDHVRAFGSACWIKSQIPGSKLDDRAKAGHMVGYGGLWGEYLVLVDGSRRVVKSIDVVFEGDNITERSRLERRQGKAKAYKSRKSPKDDEDLGHPPGFEPIDEQGMKSNEECSSVEERGEQVKLTVMAPEEGRGEPLGADTCADERRGEPTGDQDDDSEEAQESDVPSEVTIKAMIAKALDTKSETISAKLIGRSELAKMYEDSDRAEIDSHMSHGSFEVVDIPPGADLLGSFMIRSLKYHADGSLDRAKSRLVVNGQMQTQGVDFDLSFSPVMKTKSLRLLLIEAALRKSVIHTIDISTAYLNSPLKETIHVRIPKELSFLGDNRSKCMKLKKAVYGLKQAGREWNSTLHKVLIMYGWTNLIIDKCVYRRPGSNGVSYLAVYVDDLLIVTDSEDEMKEVKEQIGTQFKYRDGGPIKEFLGLKITRDADGRGFSMSQAVYKQGIIDAFSNTMVSCSTLPMQENLILPPAEKGVDGSVIREYRSMIGSLAYVARWTHPEIMFAVNRLSRYQCGPTKVHFGGVQQLLKYLRGVRDVEMRIRPTNRDITVYTDSDYIGDGKTTLSTSGYCLFVGWSSGRLRKHTTDMHSRKYGECRGQGCWDRGNEDKRFGGSGNGNVGGEAKATSTVLL